MVEEHDDLAANPSAAAHLVHGSHENRFEVVYAAGRLTKEEIESVNYSFGDLSQLLDRYDVETLSDGWHQDDQGEEFYYLQNPALVQGDLPKVQLKLVSEREASSKTLPGPHTELSSRVNVRHKGNTGASNRYLVWKKKCKLLRCRHKKIRVRDCFRTT